MLYSTLSASEAVNGHQPRVPDGANIEREWTLEGNIIRPNLQEATAEEAMESTERLRGGVS